MTISDFKLFDFQKIGVDYMSNRSFAGNFDEMGLGKTVQSIFTALELEKKGKINKCMVVCPASLKYQWSTEIQKFTNKKFVIITGSKNKRIELYRSNDSFFYIVNYELILRDIDVIREKVWDMVVLDECVRIKNPFSKTSQAIRKIPRNYRYALTGIPVVGSPLDIYSIMLFLEPNMLGNYWRFRHHFVISKKVKLKTHSYTQILGYKNLDELKSEIQDCYIRRLKKTVYSQLPDKTVQDVVVELNKDQRIVYNAIKQEIKRDIKNENSILDKILYSRRLCDDYRVIKNVLYNFVSKSVQFSDKYSNKIIELQNFLKDVDLSSHKVVIFTNWIDSQNILSKALTEDNILHINVNGTFNSVEKNKKVHEFINSKTHNVIISTDCLSYGVNLQVADILINFDFPWSYDYLQQRMARIHRIGQTNKVHIYNFYNKNTIEERVKDALNDKKELFLNIINSNNLGLYNLL